mgnify:CR=1 FL=1
MFKIGAGDYSNRVIAGSYNVNSQDVYKNWQDLNGIEHREKIRDKIVGSFDMYFQSIDEYDDFRAVLDSVRKDDLSYTITIVDNKTNTEKQIDAYLTFQLTRNRFGWNDIYERFKLNIQER